MLYTDVFNLPDFKPRRMLAQLTIVERDGS
jgi:hypothetical protein